MYTPCIPSLQYPFQLLACGHFHAGGDYFVERHNHPGYLIIYTVSGKGFLQYAGNSYTIKPGQIFIINCRDYHYYGTCGNHWEIKWFRFEGPASESFYRQIHPKAFEVFNIGEENAINEIYHDILKTAQNPCSVSDMQLSALVIKMLSRLSSLQVELFTRFENRQNNELVERAIDYMQKEYMHNITLENICKSLHISPFYFARTFRKHTGMSPHSYLTRIRISISKELLYRTNLSVGEISIQAGYENVNTFIRSFKHSTGTTPLKFRKTWAE